MTDLFGNPIIESFSGQYAFLSNFYMEAPICLWGVLFPSTEHAYQSAKTDDPEEKEWIIWKFGGKDKAKASAGSNPFIMNSPGEAKRRGRKVTKRLTWDSECYDIMTEVIIAKFDQHPGLLTKLKATYPTVLIEGNTWHDNDWGSCVCAKCVNEVKHNRLGKILMYVRELTNLKTRN